MALLCVLVAGTSSAPSSGALKLMVVETEDDRVRRELKEAKRELKRTMKMQQWLEEKTRRWGHAHAGPQALLAYCVSTVHFEWFVLLLSCAPAQAPRGCPESRGGAE